MKGSGSTRLRRVGSSAKDLVRQATIRQLLVVSLVVGISAEAEDTSTRPVGMTPIFSDGFESGDYFEWSSAEFGSNDQSPPILSFSSPSEPILVDEAAPVVRVQFIDYQSGVALDSLRVFLDEVDLLSSCAVEATEATCSTMALAAGVHTVRASIFDQGGNSIQATLSFEIVFDEEAPTVEVFEPASGALLGSRYVEVSVIASDDGLLDGVFLNGLRATLEDGLYRLILQLAEGANSIQVVAVDAAGRSTTTSIEVAVDTVSPLVVVTSPEDGSVTNESTAMVRGEVHDVSGLAVLRISGLSIPVIDGSFEASIPLAGGLNNILVEAEDAVGNLGAFTVGVEYVATPAVTVESPANPTTTNQSTIRVEGGIVGPAASVTVAGQPAVLNEGLFVVDDVPLKEGVNILDVVAVAPSGAVGVSPVVVFRDTTGPRILIEQPLDGDTVASSSIPVRGLVLDSDNSLTGTEAPTVHINGTPVELVQGSFFAPAISLVEGQNAILVEAQDALDNSSSTTLSVFREPVAALPRLNIFSGNLQTGVVGSTLSEPLTIQAVNGAGVPVPGVPIVFSVEGTDGTLSSGLRRRVEMTDTAGFASVIFSLGTYAGPGSQQVVVEATGFGRKARFFATSEPAAAARIFVDSGASQVGATGRLLPLPFVAVVTDLWSNRLPNVPVAFSQTVGNGAFADTSTPVPSTAVQVITDRNGVATAFFRLGPDEGRASHVVVARISSLPEGPKASFVSSSLVAGPGFETEVSGVALDNSGLPIPGVTVSLAGTVLSTTTGVDGTFGLFGASPGETHLLVDGSTTSLPGIWPSLDFRLFAVAGRKNSLDRPIYLLPIETENALSVSETIGGVLELPEVPGFALEVLPGSVTFPDGSRSGEVSVTPVHFDKIPMEPNFGQQPRFVVTIQPAGTTFNPPARLTLPNAEGHAPGEVTHLYSFDHDAGRFQSIGLGTTSEDATVVVSNPGTGVTKAGWHCGGDPSTTGATFDCPDCQKCTGDACVPDSGQNGSSCVLEERCRTNPRCLEGTCVGEEVLAERIDGPCIVENNGTATFSVISNDPSQITWLATGGSDPVRGEGATFSTTVAAFPTAPPTRRRNAAFCEFPPAGKEVWVGPSCSLFDEPNLFVIELEDAPVDTQGAWGVFEALTNIPSFTSCVNNPEWCAALRSYKVEYAIKFSYDPEEPNAPIALEPPWEESVTPDNCVSVLENIGPFVLPGDPIYDPNRGQGEPYPFFFSYIYLPAIEAHEEFHVEDYLEKVIEPTVADLQILASSLCQECGRPTTSVELGMAAGTILQRHTNAWDAIKEREGNMVSNAMLREVFDEIVADVISRPDADSYPIQCRSPFVSHLPQP